MIKLIVEGEPTGKGRPRVTRNGTYTPQKTKDYQNLVRWCYNLGNTKKLLTGAIECEIKAYYYIPKNTSKKKRKEMIEGTIRPTKKPDCDNVAKAILDALNGLAYKDDSQVARLVVEKYYGELPRVEVVIKELIE